MATWTNATKDSTSFTNKGKGSAGLNWDEATFTLDQGVGTWDDPFAYTNQSKNSSTFTNETKN